MIGLHPYPGAGKFVTPVFFDVSTALGEVNPSVIDGHCSLEFMVETQDAVETLHSWNESKGSHGPWGEPANGPGDTFSKVQGS